MKSSTSLESCVADIERSFGAGALLNLGKDRAQEPIAVIPTGSAALDKALGVGGLPRGRLVEVFGPEASGKTTLVQHIIANAQAAGGVCAFIDAEHSLDTDYARQTGVDVDTLLFSQPDSGENALEIAGRLIASGGVAVVAIDSVAALTPRAELAGEMGEAVVGAQARLMAQACRKLVGAAARTQTLVVFTNQLREAIGVMFGSPERQPGGRALKFAAAVRLDIRRIATVKAGDEAVANRVRVKVVKNKVAAPLRVAEFEIAYGIGIDTASERLEEGMLDGSIKKTGAWFVFKDGTKAQGEAAAKQRIRDENTQEH